MEHLGPEMEEREPGGETDAPYSATRAARVSSLILLVIALVLSGPLAWQIHSSAGAFGTALGQGSLSLATAFVISPTFRWTLALLAVAGVVKEFLVRDRTATLVANLIHVLIVPGAAEVYYREIIQGLRETLGGGGGVGG